MPTRIIFFLLMFMIFSTSVFSYEFPEHEWKKIGGFQKEVYDIKFSAKSKYLAVLAWNSCTVYDRNFKEIFKTKFGSYNVEFSPDELYLAITTNKNIVIIRLTDFKVFQVLKGHAGVTKDVAFNPDGNLIASVSADRSCIIWKFNGKKFLNHQTLENHSFQIESVTFSFDGKYLITGISDNKNTNIIWEYKKNYFNKIQTLSEKSINIANWQKSISITPDGYYIASGSINDRGITIAARSNGDKYVNSQKLKYIQNLSVLFSPDGKFLVSGSKHGTIRIRKLENNKFVYYKTIKAHQSRIRAISFSLDGRYMGSGGDDKELKIWKLNNILPIAKSKITDMTTSDKSVSDVTVQKDIIPPKITLNRGIARIEKARHTITGRAIDESGVAIVKINLREAQLDEKGNFLATILLKPGKNQVNITATDIYENQTTKIFTIERSYGTLESKLVTETIKTGNYFALLIAVQDYQSSIVSDLNQPIKDAYQIKTALNNYMFDSENIILLENPSRDKIIDTFDELSQKITKQDNLLIFYAGHGYWDKKFKQGYWLPSNATKNSRSKWLSNSTIRDYIRGIQTKHTLLVSDACFGGSIFKTRTAFDDAPPATNELYKLPSRKAMTSGTLSEVPDKSVFIEYFVKRLKENESKYLSSEQLFINFKNAVINNSPLRQVPQYGVIREAGDEGGDFIFVRSEN